jgi:hypothetical protein
LATTSPRNNNDLFITHKVNGEWREPDAVGFPISTNEGDEHCPAILQDRKTLCFASRRAGGFGGSDIYCFEQDSSGERMTPVNQGPNINTTSEEFHFTQDKDSMVYFTSARPGGYGGMDIWGAMQLSANSWGAAYNLGPQINTAGADMCPQGRNHDVVLQSPQEQRWRHGHFLHEQKERH